MSDLTAWLEALLRLYAAACDRGELDGAELAERFRKDMHSLVSEYGPKAVDAALDKLPDLASPSAALH